MGANDFDLKREALPILAQLEATLQGPAKLICKEDDTACIAATKLGYPMALRHLRRRANCSLSFFHRDSYPDKNEGSPRCRSQLSH